MDATEFKKNLAHVKLKKNTLKSCSEILNFVFSLLLWAAQTAQTDNNVFQNVANRPTVYKTGTPAIQIVAINAEKHDKNRWLRVM